MDAINWNDGDGSITQKIKDFFMGIDWAKMCTSVLQAIGKALGGLGSVVVQLLKDAWVSWKSTYIDPAIEEAGGNVIEGVFNGIANWLTNVGTWINDNILKPFIDGFKSTFDIHSPSKNPDILDLGKNLIEGLFNGVIEWISGIKDWLQENVLDKIIEAWGNLKTDVLELKAKAVEDAKNKFSDLKAKWESVTKLVDAKTLTGKAVEHAKDTFGRLKEKFEKVTKLANTKTLTGKAIEAGKSKFSDLKSKFNSVLNLASLKTLTGSAVEDKKNTFKSLKEKWNSISSKTVEFTATFKDCVTGVINSLIDRINNLLEKLKAFKVAGVEPFKNINKIPKLERGGIVNVPKRGVDVKVGENGKEAILPLQNHTEWMDALADKTALRVLEMFGGITLNNYMDGKLISREVIRMQKRSGFARGGV